MLAEDRPVMELTEAAAERVVDIIEQSGHPGAMLRVGVRRGGCAGLSYTMEVTDRQEAHDAVVPCRGKSVLVGAEAILFLLGTRVDYVQDKFSSGFVFMNPNQTGACGCGESVSICPISDSKATGEVLPLEDSGDFGCNRK